MPMPGRRGRRPGAGAWRPVERGRPGGGPRKVDARPGPRRADRRRPRSAGRAATARAADVPGAQRPGQACRAPAPAQEVGVGRPAGRGQGALGAAAAAGRAAGWRNREEEQAWPARGEARRGGAAGGGGREGA